MVSKRCFIKIEAPGAKTKFLEGASLKINGQHIIGAADNDNDSAHKLDLHYEAISPGH